MKKIVLLAAMLAMVLAVTVPALAQVAVQEFGQETDSGEIEVENAVANEGANSNLCPVAQQFTNTGNLQNGQGFVQYATTTDDIEFAGAALEAGPELEAACEQTISQASAAG